MTNIQIYLRFGVPGITALILLAGFIQARALRSLRELIRKVREEILTPQSRS